MSEIFDPQVKEALETARRLMMAGEEDIAAEMTQKIVKKKCFYNSENVLELFYGKDVCSRIQSPEQGAVCLFIAKCAIDALTVMEGRGAASSSVNPWAKRNVTVSDSRLASVFSWLCTQGRIPTAADDTYFKKLVSAFSDTVSFKMSDRVAGMYPVDVVRGLVSGRIKINSGELR